jgi:hypothetical protein
MRKVMRDGKREPDATDDGSSAIASSNHGCVFALTDPMKN